MIEAYMTWGDKQYKVYTNSLGMRDFACRHVSYSSGNKILVIGDSFVEGIGLDIRDTVFGHMCKKYKGYQFLNAACIGYSTKIYYLKTKKLYEDGLRFHKVICFIDPSDVPNEIVYKAFKPKSSLYDFLLTHSFTFLRTYKIFRSGYNFHGMPYTSREEDEPFKDLYFKCDYISQDYKYYSEGLNLCLNHISQLYSFLESKGIGLILIIYPHPESVRRNDFDNHYTASWEDFAHNREGIELINLFTESMLPEHFVMNDIHWNKVGSEVVSNLIFEKLDYYLSEDEIDNEQKVEHLQQRDLGNSLYRSEIPLLGGTLNPDALF